MTWHVGDYGSKLLFKARTRTINVNGRNRDEENHGCICRTGEKETAEELIVGCSNYETERRASLVTNRQRGVG